MHFHLFFFFLLIHNQPPLLHPLPPPSHLCYLIILSSFQMGITSLQVCMDSSDWLQGTISEEGSGVESSPITTPTGGDEMLTCSRPLMERRLRPQHEQSLKCPRCDSTHTKFCYYNNYSLSQPRYFCKTCRRYWTKGGTLRNIPVGGGCRKNTKKPSSKKSDHSPSSSSPPLLLSHSNAGMSSPPPPLSYAPTDLHLAFPDQLHFASLHAAAGLYGATTSNYLLDNSHHHANPIDFMDNKYEALLGGHEGFVSNAGFEGVMAAAAQPSASDFHGVFGMSGGVDHGNPAILESCQRLMLPYDNHLNNEVVEAKPNAKILSLEWHDHQQACNSDAGKDSFGYSFGSWTGLMNGYGSSATNPLV